VMENRDLINLSPFRVNIRKIIPLSCFHKLCQDDKIVLS
jgi:hypothetical protein